MENNRNKSVIVIAMYKPKPGKQSELNQLLKRHFRILNENGLTTDQAPFLGQSSNGTYLEVFEWSSEEASQKAHDLPAVKKIWDEMGTVCDWEKLNSLPEAQKAFPHFKRVDLK